jgi:hypothetical protein
MTFETLGGAMDCREAFLLARPPYGSSGFGDLHSPKPQPKSEISF